MPRKTRIAYAGALYHLTSRGNGKQAIFLNDDDRHHLLRLVSKTVSELGWICHRYSLMTNHYHLVLETPQPNISEGMKYINGVFTQLFNRNHQRVGHLFQGRFSAFLVEKESYFREVCRYVDLNAVRAGMCATPEEHLWSSYRATVGLASKPPFLETEFLLSLFGNSTEIARKNYAQFVRDGYNHRLWDDLKANMFLGSDSFVDRMQTKLWRPKVGTEDPSTGLLIPSAGEGSVVKVGGQTQGQTPSGPVKRLPYIAE